MPEIIQKMTFSRRAVFMPLNLAICAAVAGDNWQVEIVDENVSGPHSPATGADVVGIGAMTTQAKRAYALTDQYRKLGVPVIMGGIHPSALPQEALEHATVVCKGDAEGTLPAALTDIQADLDAGFAPGAPAGRTKTIYDWRDFPDAPIATPRKDLLNPKDYLVFNPIQTTRGCPHGCKFCTTPAIFGRKFRQRNVADIVAEITAVKEQFNSRTFIFSDDDVAGDHAWAIELFEALVPLKIKWASQCDILIARNDKLLAAMKRSGCIGLILGLESPKAQTLSEAGKRYASAETYLRGIAKIQSYSISIWGSFIFGFDNDDWRDCMRAVRFAQRAKLTMSCYPILTPYPGTEFFEQYKNEGRLLTTDWDKYNGSTVVYQPAKMTQEELRHAQMAAFHEFYQPASAFHRLGILPFKKNSWLTNMAIYRGLVYYYNKKGRPLPRFTDNIEDNPSERIAATLGIRT